ncbi:hypothetical protein P4E94_11755 [Pontiellaceae bacterium B12219]|nr:hypothetical protein [Pontiellaceae bacterium B12219]
MKIKSVLSILFVSGVVAVSAQRPDAQWTYKTVARKDLKLDVLLPDTYESAEKTFLNAEEFESYE